MTGMSGATRREFLELTIAALGPLLLGQGCGEGSEDVARVAKLFPAGITFPPTQVPLAKIVASYFQDESGKHVRAIGFAYMVPDGTAKSEQALSDALAETVHEVSEVDSVDAALARLDARIVRDFESGNVESLAGWQLSRTELHLCALSTILHV
jgi:hypothetical protein